MNAEQRRIQQIAEMAKTAFAEHRIEVRLNAGLFRNWQCSRQRSSSYLFNISTEPGRLFVTGDIGTLVVERATDMIEFAREAIGDLHYFAGKVCREIETKEFCHETAAEWVDDQVKHSSMDAVLARKLKTIANEDGHHEFCQELFDSGYIQDCDFPKCENFKFGFLWQTEAIKWLLARI